MWVHYTFWKFQWVLWVQNSCQFTVNTANKKVAWIYLSEHRISSKKQPENAAFSSNQPKNMIFFSKRPFLELLWEKSERTLEFDFLAKNALLLHHSASFQAKIWNWERIPKFDFLTRNAIQICNSASIKAKSKIEITLRKHWNLTSSLEILGF